MLRKKFLEAQRNNRNPNKKLIFAKSRAQEWRVQAVLLNHHPYGCHERVDAHIVQMLRSYKVE
jgi:folate-dependent phosphoribosylglycinamide formyltransferase PurN